LILEKRGNPLLQKLNQGERFSLSKAVKGNFLRPKVTVNPNRGKLLATSASVNELKKQKKTQSPPASPIPAPEL
jgi:hypothetical protein